MQEFWLDMALSVLFAALKQANIVEKYRKAFTKLYMVLGYALERSVITLDYDLSGKPPLEG